MRSLAIFALILTATPAFADSARRITDRAEFVSLVEGRDLTRFGVTLRVTADGRITGRAMGRDVTGAWDWRGEFFCRTLRWGGETLDGRNCQTVRLEGGRLRFTSDRGKGEYARLRLQ